MTSLLTNLRQSNTDGGYFMNIGSILGKVYNRTEAASGNTGVLGGSFSTATWVWSSPSMPTAAWASLSTSLFTAGQTILRDMGRTVVSSTRTFRKVQLVRPGVNAPSTFGVDGQVLSGESYFTGYIELGLGGEGSVANAASVAPVVRYGR